MKRQNNLKSMLCLLLGLVCHVTMAQAQVEVGTQVSVSEIENGAIYTIQGYRGGDRYMYYNGSTYDQIHTTTTAFTDQKNYMWSIHKSASGTYYLYNLGAARFIGSASGGNANIPLVFGAPVSKNFLVKESKVTDKGNVIMMTSDNGGSAMHVGNSGNGYRITNWQDAYTNHESTAECAFKVVKVAEMELSLLNDITAAVELYENPTPITGIAYNLADGKYNDREDNNQWRDGWTSTNAEKPSLTLTVGANNVNANSTEYIGLRPGSGGCNYAFGTEQTIVSIRFEAVTASSNSTGHTITIDGEAKQVGTLWKEFVIDKVYNSIAQFHLSGDNNNDCLIRNIQVVLDPTRIVKQDLYNTSKIDPENLTPPYRIPGITTAYNGRLITAAARLVCGTDPGYGEVDVVCRTSDDNGETWSDMILVADGTGEESATENIFETAFGDPAIVADRTSSEVLVIAVAGCTVYGNGNTTRQNPNMIATIHSDDNGETWGEPVNVTEDIYKLFDSGNPIQAAFVGGGKIFQSRIVKVGKYYRLYAAMCARDNGNRVIYSDDFGRTWHALGGASALPAPGGDEPKCEELPDGRVILSSRVTGGRIYNIYTYTNTATAEGSWGTSVKSTFEGSGHSAGNNSTNGEILIVPVVRNSDQKEMYLALQSLPTGGGRSHVGIYYKELTDVTDLNSVTALATDWNGFYLVTDKSSAYSSMDLQADNRIGFIYEETLTSFGRVPNPVSTCFPNGEGDHPYDGFDNIYVAYPLEFITRGKYSIKREVSRRAYLCDYYTALIADATDDMKARMTAALDVLSAEPTTAEVDKLNLIATAAQEEGETWYYLRYKETGRNSPTLPNGSWGYLKDDLRFTATQEKSDAQLWRKVAVGDGTYHIVSKTGKYIVPASTISSSTTAPEATWTIEASDTEGLEVIYNASLSSQMHANKDTHLINWGYNTNGTGPRKNDAGCNFAFVEAATMTDVLDNLYEYDADAGKVGYYTDATIATYKSAVWAAMLPEQIDAAKATVLASTEWNMPVSGKAYTFKNVQKDGSAYWFTYNSTNNRIDLTTNEQEATPFVCRLLDNGKYVFVCNDGKYLAWRGDTGSGVRDTYDATEAAYTDVSVEKLTTGVNINGDQSATRYVYLKARRSASDANGCYIVTKSSGSFGNSSAPFYNDDYSSAIIMEEAEEAFGNAPQVNDVEEGELLSEDLHNKHMSTFSATYATVVPEGVTAYYATREGENVDLNAIAAGKAIPANTGVILVSEEGGNVVMLPAAGETVADVTGNLMGHSAGAVKDMTDVANAYLLTKGTQGVGFYRCSGGTLAANKAYLQLESAQASVRMRLKKTSTDIEESTLNPQPSTQTYDLMGRRVETMTKGGIYIVNGKKVVIK